MLNCIGIDVSKSTLNVHICKNNQDLEIENNLKSVKKLYAKLKKIYKKELEKIVFIFEPIGSYSELLRKFCFEQQQIKCFIINPKQFSKEKEKKIIIKVQEMINANPSYKKAFNNITSITGIGQIGGIALLHLFIKYPEANQRQITSLVGLNPIYKKSGSSLRSLYRISKSDSIFYRGSLFMGVMTAVRYDENFKAFYACLKAKGKHTTQAQIAVMRKMIIMAHSLYKNDKKNVKPTKNTEVISMD